VRCCSRTTTIELFFLMVASALKLIELSLVFILKIPNFFSKGLDTEIGLEGLFLNIVKDGFRISNIFVHFTVVLKLVRGNYR
jgi:hypothetical protein